MNEQDQQEEPISKRGVRLSLKDGGNIFLNVSDEDAKWALDAVENDDGFQITDIEKGMKVAFPAGAVVMAIVIPEPFAVPEGSGNQMSLPMGDDTPVGGNA